MSRQTETLDSGELNQRTGTSAIGEALAAGEVEDLDVPGEAVDARLREELARGAAAEELEAALGVADAGHGEELDDLVAGLAEQHPVEGLALAHKVGVDGPRADRDGMGR